MHRHSRKYPVQEIVDLAAKNEPTVYIESFKIKLRSLKMLCFFTTGMDCKSCGIQGEYFVLEGHTRNNAHLNLYALRDGKEVLMTRDHVVAKADGGSNTLENLQTMCSPCNSAKSSEFSRNYNSKRALMLRSK